MKSQARRVTVRGSEVGNSSYQQHPAAASAMSLDKARQSFTPNQPTLFSDEFPPNPGSFNDENLVRSIITESITNSAKSRDQVADEMTLLVGSRVSIRMLNSYTSEAAEQHRWPTQYTRAFCYVVQDWTLLRCIVERAGFHMITRQEHELLELGREYLKQKRANDNVQLLEQRLRGVEL